MGRVYVSHLKARTLTREATWAQSRDTTLVRHLRQWVVLVHKLRQLTGAKEFFDRSGNWLGVDKVLRHQAFALRHGQTLFNRALNTHKTDSELVLRHLANGADSAVSKVVDIVYDTLAVTNINQTPKYRNDVFFIQRSATYYFVTAQASIEFHTPD